MQALLELNFLPIRYTHVSWFNGFSGGKLLNRLRPCKRVEYKLSQYILEQLGIENTYCFDIPSHFEQIAFLPSLDMLRLVRYLGVSVYSDELAKCIDGNEVRQIKQTIGDDAYIFGLKRAPFISHDFVIPKIKSNTIHLSDKIWMSGMQCLTSLMSDMDVNLKKRVLLKLPNHWSDEIPFQRGIANENLMDYATKVYAEVIH